MQFARGMVSSVGQNSSPQTRLDILISNYNLLNPYFPFANLVGLHCNYFGSEESLENKVLLVNEARTETCSHGGPLTSNTKVFALIDWGYEKQQSWAWYVDNAHRYALDHALNLNRSSQGYPEQSSCKEFHE